jgi:predicted dithiol-disulfide oxidoreductase (DUF899 family)
MPDTTPLEVTGHPVVSRAEWLKARTAFLAKEKEFTKLGDELTRQRHELPWTKVEKHYTFEGPKGKESLSDLFDGRSQLVVYQFMFDPDWKAGCPICSFWADNFDNIIQHLNHRDVTMVAISRAPCEKLAAYEKRMGWRFKWLSSHGTDFNFDHQASFTPEEVGGKQALYNFTKQDPRKSEREGVSVFYKDGAGKIFQTYAAYARGIDMLNTAYHYLDIVPRGRDEGGRGPFWVKRHDEYGD